MQLNNKALGINTMSCLFAPSKEYIKSYKEKYIVNYIRNYGDCINKWTIGKIEN